MSLKASHVLLKKRSHGGIEENINPSQLQSMFLGVIEGLACTFDNDFASHNVGKCHPRSTTIIVFENH